MKEKISIKEKGTSVSANSLIWFGAGVSIAEILTGTYLAPLGFGKGLAAIVLGHVIGCALLLRTQCPAAGGLDLHHDL